MKKILFIEDESALQKTFGDLLGARGYHIVSALDGEIGLALAQKEKPDLILLDIVLPKINGLEVLSQLKENPETKTIPVILLTNLEGMNNIGKALELGATTYLVKAQYSLNEVVEKIEKALNV
jgi:CheY-like chemotaxis protein